MSSLTSVSIPSDLMDQWRDANQAGEGRAFGSSDQVSLHDAAEDEGAQVLCRLDTPDCYLVVMSDNHYVVCDCHGWWACRVEL